MRATASHAIEEVKIIKYVEAYSGDDIKTSNIQQTNVQGEVIDVLESVWRSHKSQK